MSAQFAPSSACPCPTPAPAPAEAVLPDDACIGRDLQGRIERWSPAAEALFGYAEQEALGQGAELLLPESHRHESLWLAHRLAQGENILHLYTRRRHKSGQLLPVSLTARARRGADGRLLGFDKRYRRLGDECAIVRQLALEAGDFARLFARTPMPMCITRMTDGTVLALNTSFQDFMGRAQEELLGHRTLELGLWRSAGERNALLERLHREGRVHNAPLVVQLGRQAGPQDQREVLANIEPVTLGGQPCLYVLLNDISGWRQAERQLQRRDREFADLVDSASDAIVSIDARQRVCLFNRAAEQMFQVSAEDALGQTLDRFIPGEWRSRHAALVQQFIDSGAEARRMGSGRVIHGCRADGSVFPIEASISRVGQGESLRLTVVARDVSQAKAAEQDHLARIAAESASQAKTAFLSRMSHELRTPLNAVLGFTQLLLSGRQDPLSQAQVRQVELVQQAGWHLLALINDVLDLSRIEGGQLRVEARAIDPIHCLQEALALAMPQAQASGIALAGPAPDADLPVILADPLRLRQVLLNLLSNAIKYNRAHGEVRLSAQRQADGRLQVQVCDSGLGLTAEQLQHLYEPFNRLGRERSHTEGTGIGLVLSRELMRLMGGELQLHSTPGQGTCVTLWLPTAPAGTPPAPPAAAPAPDAAAGTTADADWGGRVLYIEDNPVNQMVMAQLMARCPTVSLTCVETGAAGLQAVAEQTPDLVLLDMQLPDMSGLEWLQRQAAAIAEGRLRVIAVSASAMSGDVAAARSAGAVDYWTKPLRLDQVVHDLAGWLREPASPAH